MNIIPPFKPASLLHGAHRQTVWSPLFRRSTTLYRTRERLTLPDGDFLDLDWCGDDYRKKASAPIIVLIHGLTGSSDSKYILGIQKVLKEHHWQSVAVNLRGCSGEPNLLTRSYHSGDSDELSFIFQSLRNRFPNQPLAAIGYSLGGNMLLKYQGEQGNSSLLDCAIAVSVPFRLDLCAAQMNRGRSRIYRNRFLTDLHRLMKEKSAFFHQQGWTDKAGQLDSFIKLGTMKTFEAFDHHITAPMHGFRSGLEYYQQASCRQHLQDIARPTLIIHSSDDPFMTADSVPKRSELSGDIVMDLHHKGGHLGFVKGSPLAPEYWLEQRIPRYLIDVLGQA